MVRQPSLLGRAHPHGEPNAAANRGAPCSPRRSALSPRGVVVCSERRRSEWHVSRCARDGEQLPWLFQVLSQQMTSPRSAPLPVAPLASTPTRVPASAASPCAAQTSRDRASFQPATSAASFCQGSESRRRRWSTSTSMAPPWTNRMDVHLSIPLSRSAHENGQARQPRPQL
jgi:hypothetical protein